MGTIPLRHSPTQKRSRNRVEKILLATEKLFSTIGFEQTTTNAIAEEAGVPIGSFYQYFNNKITILRLISERYRQEMQVILTEHFKDPLVQEDFIHFSDNIIDKMMEFYRTHPAFQVVFYGSCIGDEFGRITDEFLNEIITNVAELLHSYLPTVKKDVRLRVAAILVRTVRSNLPVCIDKGKINVELLDEVKTLVRFYLAGLKASI